MTCFDIKVLKKAVSCIFLFSVVIVFFCLNIVTVTAAPINGIIVYPVPLNPGKQTLTIEDRGGGYSGKNVIVRVQVFDINGDLLFDRNYTSLPIYWKGYSTSGKSVSNGFYIIKLSIEELDTGTISKKKFRILVKR